MHAPSIAILFLAISGAYASGTPAADDEQHTTRSLDANDAKISLTHDQAYLVLSIEEKIYSYQYLPEIEAINSAIEEFHDRYIANQTVDPTSLNDGKNSLYYEMFKAGYYDGFASAIATQTAVVGPIRESYASDVAAHASILVDIAGYTKGVENTLPAKTSTASGTSATGTLPVKTSAASGTSATGTASDKGSAGSSTSAPGLNGMFVAVLAGVLALAVTL